MASRKKAKKSAGPKPCELVIVADSPSTEIWLGNDHGHLIQRGTGMLEASLVPGDYTVEFGLGAFPYPIRLEQPTRYTESDLAAHYGSPHSLPPEDD
jgi:hypothetical protein